MKTIGLIIFLTLGLLAMFVLGGCAPRKVLITITKPVVVMPPRVMFESCDTSLDMLPKTATQKDVAVLMIRLIGQLQQCGMSVEAIHQFLLDAQKTIENPTPGDEPSAPEPNRR